MSVYGRVYLARFAPAASWWRDAIYAGAEVVDGGKLVREAFSPDAPK